MEDLLLKVAQGVFHLLPPGHHVAQVTHLKRRTEKRNQLAGSRTVAPKTKQPPPPARTLCGGVPYCLIAIPGLKCDRETGTYLERGKLRKAPAGRQ